jgi:hypothetical protein
MGGSKFKGVGLPSRCTGLAAYDSQDFEHWGRSGVLERIIVNVADTLGTIDIHDEVDGVAAGTMKAQLKLGLAASSVVECGFIMNSGLTVNLAAADDVTVVYNANRD